jgi:hypothetical protein
MGTLSRYTGSIEFSQPLKWIHFKDHDAAHPNDVRLDCDVRLVIENDTVETEDGLLSVRKATAVVPITDDRFKGYCMQEHLQSVVDMALDAVPEMTFRGRIDAVCEDGERWRFKVVNGKVEMFQPVTAWPAGAGDDD